MTDIENTTDKLKNISMKETCNGNVQLSENGVLNRSIENGIKKENEEKEKENGKLSSSKEIHDRNPRYSLDSLPEELKIYLMTFFDIPSFTVTTCLNKRWNELTERSSLWKSLCYREFGSKLILETDKYKTWKSMFKDYSIPLENDPIYQSCFYGYLGEQKADQILKAQHPGTFLFRSSNTDPNAITISFVVNDGSKCVIRHRRMHRLGQGQGYSFHLPGYKRELQECKIYKNYIQLLNSNTWLTKPLISELADSVKTYYSATGTIDIHCPDYTGPPSSAQIQWIAQNIRQNKTVAKELIISANLYFGYKIGYPDLTTLAESLEFNNSITYVNITHMHLNSTVCQALGRSLLLNTSITKLQFHHCACEQITLGSIIQSLKTNICIQELIINNNLWTRNSSLNNISHIRGSDFVDFTCLPWECAS